MANVGLSRKCRVRVSFPILFKFHFPEGYFTKNHTQPYIPTRYGFRDYKSIKNGFLFMVFQLFFKHLSEWKAFLAYAHSFAYIAPRAFAAGKMQDWRTLAVFQAGQKPLKKYCFRLLRAKVLTGSKKLLSFISQYVMTFSFVRLLKSYFNSYLHSYPVVRVPVPGRPVPRRLFTRGPGSSAAGQATGRPAGGGPCPSARKPGGRIIPPCSHNFLPRFGYGP